METHGNTELETVRTMFGFCQYTGGRYFGEDDDVGPAQELKAKATAAKGLTEGDGRLMTLDRFLRKHYSPSKGNAG